MKPEKDIHTSVTELCKMEENFKALISYNYFRETRIQLPKLLL